MSKKKTIEELEDDNENLLRILTKRKDAGAAATITELTGRLSTIQSELTKAMAEVQRLGGRCGALEVLLAKTGEDADDAKEALETLTRKKK